MLEAFDHKLAGECAKAFSRSTGLGCAVSDNEGNILFSSGHSCAECGLCAAIGQQSERCVQSHLYGMLEAERFGGKYIYFCPTGLTCFVSPILGGEGSEAKITAGPFLMVDTDDYIASDLEARLGTEATDSVRMALERVPYVPPATVDSIATLLFMAVGFLNDVSATERMSEARASLDTQGQISSYIADLKRGGDAAAYPLATERALIVAITASDREKARALLNELLGYILFSSGGDTDRIKSRVYELLVLMSRTAVEAGVSAEQSFELNHDFFIRSRGIHETEALCMLITDIMYRYTNSIFRYADLRHKDIIRKAIHYIKTHYASPLTLEDAARYVYLSPTYFSKVFKKEAGESFTAWLGGYRIERSKQLLAGDLSLAEIAGAVGFEDQSYFSRVFKKLVGVSPGRYRVISGMKKTQ